jgi:hypothetical protein
MAVEIVNSGNKEYLEVLYHFNDDKLTTFSPALFLFTPTTSSNIIFLQEKYSAIKLHLTKKLHHQASSKSLEYLDMVVECHGTEQLSKKLFICIGIEFNRSEGTFDLQSPNFNSVFSQLKSTSLYQTKTGNFVFVSNITLLSARDAPTVYNSAKVSYKEIIEPDSFNFSAAVETAKQNALPRVETKTTNVAFKSKPASMESSGKELDLLAGKEGFLAGTGSYMECKLLKTNATDKNTVYEDVAVVPLKTNTYERGMVAFSHFLHFFLVSFGAGLGFPNLLVTVFEYRNFIDEKTGSFNLLRSVVGFFSLFVFFLTGLVLMIVGLADPKFIRGKKNNEAIKDGSVIATVGFYFVLIHCSFALGMFAFKKFETINDGKDNKFFAMFDNKMLGASSFFDILDGLKTPPH